jgi:hypothetical protein
LVAGAAVSYAYLAPATYRSEALVLLEIPDGAASRALPPVQQWPERLRGTLLVASELEPLGQRIDRALYGKAARERALDSIAVRAVGGRTFGIAFTGRDPAGAQHASNLLAARVSGRGPAALGAPGRAPRDSLVDQRLRELASFVAKQPEVVAVERHDAENDAARAAHVDPRGAPEVTFAVAPAVTPAITPQVVSRWNELVLAVAEARRDAAKHPHPATVPAVTARVIAPAAWPETPLSPNRSRIIWLGVLLGLGSSALWMLAHTLLARRGVRLAYHSTSEEQQPKTGNSGPSWQSDASVHGAPVVPLDWRPAHQDLVLWEPPAPLEEAGGDDPSVAFVDVRWQPPATLHSLDAYRSLRGRILGLALDHCTVVLVAGAANVRDRKSRVAGQLAFALAETGHARILLLEGDFENPGVSSTLSLEMPMACGLSHQLEACVRGGPPSPLTVLRCSSSLHVLAEGVIRSPGLVLSVVFEAAILRLRGYFDVIVIDGPPATASVELTAIDGLVDAVVYADPALDAPCETTSCAPDPAISALFGNKRLLTAVSA